MKKRKAFQKRAVAMLLAITMVAGMVVSAVASI